MFVLQARDGSCEVIGFSDAAATTLVAHLSALPDFDTHRLRDVIMNGPAHSMLTRLWSRD